MTGLLLFENQNVMELNAIFNRLWNDYTRLNPSAGKIHKLFENEGETVVNDHIAFRTLNDPRINIDIIATPFVKNGYKEAGEYVFEDKHLFAKHYELSDKDPRIFISQLILEDMPVFVKEALTGLLDQAENKLARCEDLIFSGNIFEPLSYDIYNRFREVSEYAAWFYVFGFRANHFTVSVNDLHKNNSIEKVNQLLMDNGFKLNTSGGSIKGTEQDMLRQSSTLADVVTIHFSEGDYNIPCCYYEFAQRYRQPDGNVFGGFVAKSADKIFESTNNYVAGK
ncbi:MAG TPA: DUF1338 domain-containing protein [Bacteroidales bacterium]|nr:DUF1338 domain-containing protein [Bacteroidales bacterium]